MLHYLAVIREKYNKLMTGRYGIFDTLNRDMLILWAAVGFINMFIRSRVVRFVLPVLPVLVILRLISENTVKRGIENRKYIDFRNKAAELFKIQYKRIKEHKTHRYYKCKNCSAYLRVPHKKGEHTVSCPKCGKEFSVKIR